MAGFTRKECRIYVGNLPPDVRTKDIEDLFYKFGKISHVELKNSRGPPFAFVEFEDARDAEEAVESRQNYNFDGYHLRVEHPRGDGQGNAAGYSRGDGGGRYGGGRGDHGGPLPTRGRGGPPTRRSQHRLLISGLPPTGSWQDVKDHMREAGDVCYADVYKDGTGVVEFIREDDMRYAIKKLDDSKFRSHENEIAYIRVREEGRHRSRSRSRSPQRARRSRTRSRSPR